jgi:hypothetical protein
MLFVFDTSFIKVWSTRSSRRYRSCVVEMSEAVRWLPLDLQGFVAGNHESVVMCG